MKGLKVVLAAVESERWRQQRKWGEQNHPDGTGAFKPEAERFRAQCDRLFREGRGTWKDILFEELFEAMAETDPVKLREELIQTAAVIVAWVEAIDRRTSEGAAELAETHRSEEQA